MPSTAGPASAPSRMKSKRRFISQSMLPSWPRPPNAAIFLARARDGRSQPVKNPRCRNRTNPVSMASVPEAIRAMTTDVVPL